jgi:hypothetical protein
MVRLKAVKTFPAPFRPSPAGRLLQMIVGQMRSVMQLHLHAVTVIISFSVLLIEQVAKTKQKRCAFWLVFTVLANAQFSES